jgi:hypothetical protein
MGRYKMNEFEKQVAAAFLDVGMFVALTTTLITFDRATCESLLKMGVTRLKEQNFLPEVIDEVSERLERILAVKAKEEELQK